MYVFIIISDCRVRFYSFQNQKISELNENNKDHRVKIPCFISLEVEGEVQRGEGIHDHRAHGGKRREQEFLASSPAPSLQSCHVMVAESQRGSGETLLDAH